MEPKSDESIALTLAFLVDVESLELFDVLVQVIEADVSPFIVAKPFMPPYMAVASMIVPAAVWLGVAVDDL